MPERSNTWNYGLPLPGRLLDPVRVTALAQAVALCKGDEHHMFKAQEVVQIAEAFEDYLAGPVDKAP